MLSAAPNSSSEERLWEHPGQVGRKRWGRAGRWLCCRDGSMSAAGGGRGQPGCVGKLDLMETPPRAGWWGGGAGWMRCAREDQGIALGWQPSTGAGALGHDRAHPAGTRVRWQEWSRQLPAQIRRDRGALGTGGKARLVPFVLAALPMPLSALQSLTALPTPLVFSQEMCRQGNQLLSFKHWD